MGVLSLVTILLTCIFRNACCISPFASRVAQVPVGSPSDHLQLAIDVNSTDSLQLAVDAVANGNLVDLQDDLCIPDYPGNLRNAGLCMALGMVLVAFAGFYAMQIAGRMSQTPASLPPPAAQEAIESQPELATTPEPRSKNPSIEAINGMRTVLVTYVIILHYQGGIPDWRKKVLFDGWPMQFFFVLSGFILQYVISGKHEMLDWPAGLKLLVRRWMRLVPLYELAILLCYLTECWFGARGKPWMSWPMNALLLEAILPVRICGAKTDWTLNFIHFNANGVGWFTAILTWVTCCFPFLYNNLPRKGVGKISALLFAIFVCRSLPEVFRPPWGCWNRSMALHKEECNGFMHLYAFAPLRVLEFAAGMLSMSLVTQLSPKIQALNWGWAFDFFCVLAAVGAVFSANVLGMSSMFSGDFLITPIWCMVCAAACMGAKQKATFPFTAGPLYAVLSAWPLAPLGQYSFEAYILHHALLDVWWLTEWRFMQQFPVNLIFVWLVAFMVDKWIQDPLSKAVNAKLNPK